MCLNKVISLSLSLSLITLWTVIILFWIQRQNINLKIEANSIKYCMRKEEWGITVSKVGKRVGRGD